MLLTPALKNHFLNLYNIAISDSQVDVRELETLYRLGEAKGIKRSDIDSILLQPQQSEFSVPETVLEKIDCLYDLCLIAWADGQIESAEKDMIASFCLRFGFREENISQICAFLLEEASRNTPKENVLFTVSQNL